MPSVRTSSPAKRGESVTSRISTNGIPKDDDQARFLGSHIHALEVLNQVGQRCVRPGNDFEGCLAVIVDAAITLTAAEKCTVQVWDNDIGALKLVAHRGFNRPFLQFFDLVSTQGSVCESAMSLRARVVVPDITYSKILAGTPSLRVLLEAGLRAVQSTPLISSSGALLGMISTHYTIPTDPPKWRLTLMDLLARQTADYLERKHAERALKTSEDDLRRFVNAVPTAIIRCSRDLRYLSANTACAEILGLPLDQIIGKRIIDVLGSEAFEAIRPRIERVLRGERVEYEGELPYRSPHGPRYVHVIYIPESNENGDVVGWISSVTDMTDFREAEQRLAKMEKLAAAGQLAASLAHEINNPLSAVTNCLYLLQQQNNGRQTTKDLLDLASNELARVGRIVSQSLSYYRVDDVAQKLDIALLIRDSMQIFHKKFHQANVQVKVKFSIVPAIVGYPDEMRQVIDNLFLNAVQSMPRGGALTIALHPSRWLSGMNGVRLTIADTGCGMTRTVQKNIFQPFFTTKTDKGTGLGLWVVKGILSKHGATIHVRSSNKPGKSGTIVSILCPTELSHVPAAP